MEKYDDRPAEEVRFTDFRIVVPSEQDKQDLLEAFEHIHDSEIDTNFVPVNQLAHVYYTPERGGNDEITNMIIVDPKSFDRAYSIDNERVEMAKLKKKGK